MSDNIPTLPASWAPYLPIATGIARKLLAVAGSYHVTWALAVTDSDVQMATGAAMIVASVLWSGWQKIRAQRALDAAAAAPAGVTIPKLPA